MAVHQNVEVVKVGLIGTGRIAEFHAKSLSQIQGAELTAVYSPNAEHSGEFARNHATHSCASLDEFLNSKNIDAVIVATPTETHLEVARHALLSGKHVLIEKPVVFKPSQARELEELSASNHLICHAIHQMRFGEGTQLVHKTVESGRMGRIALADIYIKWFRPAAENSNGSMETLEEFIFNHGWHPLDMLLWLLGPVESVSAMAHNSIHASEAESDTFTVSLKFRSGTLGIMAITTVSYPGFALRLEMSGEKGSFCIEDDHIVAWRFVDETREDVHIRERFGLKVFLGYGTGLHPAVNYRLHMNNLLEFINCVRKKDTAAGNSFHQTCHLVDVLAAIHEAVRNRNQVNIAPPREHAAQKMEAASR